MRLLTFDSQKVGDEIPALTIRLLTRRTLALYCGASRDHNPIHMDIDFAKLSGLDEVIAHGLFSTGFFTRMHSNWVPQSAVRSWNNSFTVMTRIGDSATCTGKIFEKFEEGGEKLMRLELQTNITQAQTIVAEAVVA